MERSALSMKWLEVFQAIARSGSLRDASAQLGVSISTVSHHLSCLERAVGAPLVDHSKRPMRLTNEGEILLRRVDEALSLLRRGLTEVWADDLEALSRVLRVAHIEEFAGNVVPDIAHELSRALPGCEFSFLSRTSHEIIEMLQGEDLDVGVAAATERHLPGVSGLELLRDPFILVTHADERPPRDLPALLALCDRSPFLRYGRRLIIGQRIDAHFRRLHIRLPVRMEFESTESILTMVAGGRGWTVTTALNYARERAFHDATRPAWFPQKGFTRLISLFLRDDLPPGLREIAHARFSASAQKHVIGPIVARHPWLEDEFRVLAAPNEAAAGDARAAAQGP